ncbi:MAG: ABC transporter permease [Polyangiaceae bacterium]|nr:ABC transporter permease [Polyangiaceae bacterium]
MSSAATKAAAPATPATSAVTTPPRQSAAYQLGNSILELSETAGGMAVLLVRVVWRIVRASFDWNEFKTNMYKMGVKSTPIVVVTALFVGAISVIQAAPMVQQYGAYGLIGWGAGFGVLRELGPLLTALMISGRVGANNTAELGTMVVTEQIDALRILAIDPLGFLIAPRLLAIVLTLLIATTYADALALFGAAVASKAMLGVEYAVFVNGLTGGLLNFGDVAHGLVKSVFFGLMMAISSCYFGLAVKGGAPGVGRAVNAGVVASATGIFILDYFVSFVIG